MEKKLCTLTEEEIIKSAWTEHPGRTGLSFGGYIRVSQANQMRRAFRMEGAAKHKSREEQKHVKILVHSLL